MSPAAGPAQHYSLYGLVPDGAQGAIALWEFVDPLPDFSGAQHTIAAQRVDVLGNRPAPWGATGSALMTWLDSSPTGIHGAIPLGFLPDGAGGGTSPTITLSFSGDNLRPFQLHEVTNGGATSGVPGFSGSSAGYPVLDAAADPDGAGGVFMVGWQQTFAVPPATPPPGPLFAQHVSAAGAELWTAVPIAPAGNAGTGGLAALADGSGGAYFAWIDVRDALDPDLYVQHVDAGGAIPQDWPSDGLLVCGVAGAPGAPHLATDGAGGAFLAWSDARDGVNRVYVHHARADASFELGIPTDGRAIPLSGLSDAFVNFVSDGEGGLFLAREWTTSLSQAISALHRLDAAGSPRPGWPSEGIALNDLTPGVGTVGLAADGGGGVFVSWRNGFGSLAPQGLYANHFDATGSPAPGWTTGGYRLSGNGQESTVVRSGSGAIVAWNDSRMSAPGIYAQRLIPEGPVATELALVSATTGEEGVSLDWYADGAVGLVATIERRDATSGWSAIGEATGNAAGHLIYVDAGAAPGARLAYRARWSEGGATRTTGEVWVEVPAAARLALAPPRPNPSTGPVSFRISLARGGTAALDVMDVAGRRISHRSLDRLGPGDHVVSIDEAGAWPAGLYEVRLTQGGQIRHARLVRAP